MAIMMILCTILSFAIVWWLCNMAKNEKDSVEQMVLGASAGMFMLFGLGGTLGIIVKTLGIWGNSW